MVEKKLTLDDLNLSGRRVLVRVDFNVPLDEEGHVREFTRIKASLPTIHNIIDYDGIAILMSHFGRPGGKRDDRYTLKPIIPEIERLLGKKIKFVDDCIGPDVEKVVRELKPKEVLLLENVRFHPGESENDEDFAKKLASLGKLFVNDAFGAAHRKQASIHAITKFFPNRAAAGRLMIREIRFLIRTLRNPKKPFTGIVGGAKISSKIKTVNRLLPQVDKLLIGGGIAYTLVKAQGGNIGDSLCQNSMLSVAEEILNHPDSGKIVLPSDTIAAQSLDYGSERRTFPINEIPDGWIGLDLGRESRQQYMDIIRSSKTCFWNGPMGLFEREPYAPGTRMVARAMVDLFENGGISVLGGGDTMAAVDKFHLTDVTHISTGGGSLLEFIEGRDLPGIEALSNRQE